MRSMDRVRVGLTGLGAVFLLTLGTSLLFGGSEGDRAVAESRKEPGEPLAQLGVAPGSEKPDPGADNGAESGRQSPGTPPEDREGHRPTTGPVRESPVGTSPDARTSPERAIAGQPVAI